MKICILGAGTWGVAIARHLSNCGHSVTVWSAIAAEIDGLQETYVHPNLKNIVLPRTLRFTKQISACANFDMVVFAVPSVYMRTTAKSAAPYLHKGQIAVNLAKGIEPDTYLTMSQIIEEEINFGRTDGKISCVVLSGPTHAEEVAQDLPTAIVSACRDPIASAAVRDAFSGPNMRVYTVGDAHGVEICGALKNIMALAAGISTGIGYGDNAKAAIITRGMAEIARLGRAMGCSERTFWGLAGVGDLIVTATSMHSRNNRAGQLIGSGMTAEEAVEAVGMVVEGLNALPAAVGLAQRYGVDMPIVDGVNAIVSRHADPRAVVVQLMARESKNEGLDA